MELENFSILTLVKLDIEDTISGRDDIILEVEETIEMVKNQVSEKPYWAIFISQTAEIEYIMSDTLNDEYLNDLNKFENLRDKIGGTILRSKNEEVFKLKTRDLNEALENIDYKKIMDSVCANIVKVLTQMTSHL